MLKCASALVLKGGKVLLSEHAGSWMAPSVAVARGSSYRETLAKHLGAGIKVGRMKSIHRFVIRSEGSELRANFIVFDCTGRSTGGRWFSKLPRNVLLRGLFEES